LPNLFGRTIFISAEAAAGAAGEAPAGAMVAAAAVAVVVALPAVAAALTEGGQGGRPMSAIQKAMEKREVLPKKRRGATAARPL
jgi:hypothetical protein